MTIRVLLVDDHQMFREGLRAVLERDSRIKVIGEASDGRDAMSIIAGPDSPDIVVMDIGMPGLNGIEATRQIVSKNPNAKVIALSGHSDRRFVAAMLEAGASAYILKESAAEEILRAVTVVHRGGKCLSPEITGVVIDNYLLENRKVGNIPHAHSQLAAREREIVQLLAEGKTSKEIASVLHISVKTVETHRRNIMSKLKLSSVAALTKFAIREGLTSIEG